MQPKTLLAFAAGPLASAALGVVTVPLLAWGLEPVDVGRYNSYQTFANFFLLFTTLGLDQAFVREYHDTADRAALLRAVVLPGLLAAFAVVAVVLSVRGWFVESLYLSDVAWLVPLTLACGVLAFFGRFLNLVLRMEERAVAYSALDVLPRAVLILLVLPFVLAGLELRIAHLLAVVCLSSLLSVIISATLTRPTWSGALRSVAQGRAMGPLLSLGLPLFVASLTFWALSATGLIALRTWSTLESVAQYSVAMSIGNVAGIVQAMFTVIWAPMVFRWIARNEDLNRIDAVVDSIVAIGCSLLCVTALLSPLVGLFLPDEYAIVPSLLACALLPPMLYTVAEAAGMGIVVVRKSGWAVAATALALATNVTFAAWLVPRLGAAGAVVAGAIAFTVFFFARTEISMRLWRPLSRGRTYPAILIAVGLSVATTVLGRRHGPIFTVLWALAFVAVMLGYRAVWSDLWERLLTALRKRSR